MPRALPIFLAALALGSACGGAKEGDSCNQNGFLCADAANALECKAGQWVKLPCRGSAGCTRTNDVIKCDMTGDLAGDNCASTAEGKGLCTAAGTATLDCRSGVLVQTNTCSSCSVSGDQVICQP